MNVLKVRWLLLVGFSVLVCITLMLSGCVRFDGAVDFTADPTAGKKPLSVRFTPQVDGSVQRCIWNFGDGQTSTERFPEHTYTEVGTYTVILTVVPRRGEPASVMRENCIMVRAGFGAGSTTLVVQDDEFDLTDWVSIPVVTTPWGGAAYVLDVLANDTPGAGATGLTIVGVRSPWGDAHDSGMAEANEGIAWISADGTTIEYEPLPGAGNLFSDSFYCLVTDGQTTAEGEVRVDMYDPFGHP